MMNADNLPPALAPVYHQYVIDRILHSRGPGDTPYKALKCIGLYRIILRMGRDHDAITHSSLAARIGTTYPGILKPLEYLKRLGLVKVEWRKLPGTMSNAQVLVVPQSLVEYEKKWGKRVAAAQNGKPLMELGHEVPAPWQDILYLLLDKREPKDTPAKALKAIGLAHVMARIAAEGLPVTRPIVARILDVSENTLVPQIELLERLEVVTVTERRIAGHIGMEFQIEFPKVVVEAARRDLRRLDKELAERNWVDGLEHRLSSRLVIENSAARHLERLTDRPKQSTF